MSTEAPDDLNEREQYLLRVLVESYIRDGQPVGSRALTRDSGLQLSSATIRNIVADLEHLGFVTSPHTSAGRIPTDKGYRFFVDSILKSGRALSGIGRGCVHAAVECHPAGWRRDHSAGPPVFDHAYRVRLTVGEPRTGRAGVRRS